MFESQPDHSRALRMCAPSRERMSVLGCAREPVAGAFEVAGYAMAAFVEQAQAEFGERKATLGRSAVVGEATGRIRRRAGTGQQGKADPVTCEELGAPGVASRRRAVRRTRVRSGERQPPAGAGAEDTGSRIVPCVENSLHGGRRSRSEQAGGVSLVAGYRAAGGVKFAEREQPLRIVCRSRSAQMPQSSHVVAGDVPRNQTESEMSRCIASRGHGGEMGARPFVALGRGALQPLERFGPVVSRPGLIEVREGQQVLGRRMALDRHAEQNRPALHARVG